MPLKNQIVDMIKKASTNIPSFVESKLIEALKIEQNQLARILLKTLLENIKIAREEMLPICQDTGIPIFFVKAPRTDLYYDILEAVDIATEEGFLRPNSVSIKTDRTIGNFPEVYFFPDKKIHISLLLKGGGSSYVAKLYSLPPTKAKKILPNVIKEALIRAGSKPCPPVFIGVGLGGSEAKALLNAELALVELPNKNFLQETLPELNSIQIGAMGVGGTVTVLDINYKGEIRHPATFLVGISFNCWALRRSFLEIRNGKVRIWQ